MPLRYEELFPQGKKKMLKSAYLGLKKKKVLVQEKILYLILCDMLMVNIRTQEREVSEFFIYIFTSVIYRIHHGVELRIPKDLLIWVYCHCYLVAKSCSTLLQTHGL